MELNLELPKTEKKSEQPVALSNNGRIVAVLVKGRTYEITYKGYDSLVRTIDFAVDEVFPSCVCGRRWGKSDDRISIYPPHIKKAVEK